MSTPYDQDAVCPETFNVMWMPTPRASLLCGVWGFFLQIGWLRVVWQRANNKRRCDCEPPLPSLSFLDAHPSGWDSDEWEQEMERQYARRAVPPTTK